MAGEKDIVSFLEKQVPCKSVQGGTKGGGGGVDRVAGCRRGIKFRSRGKPPLNQPEKKVFPEVVSARFGRAEARPGLLK